MKFNILLLIAYVSDFKHTMDIYLVFTLQKYFDWEDVQRPAVTWVESRKEYEDRILQWQMGVGIYGVVWL